MHYVVSKIQKTVFYESEDLQGFWGTREHDHFISKEKDVFLEFNLKEKGYVYH